MSATSRYLLEEAPGGLFLVQDLLNTSGVPAYGVRDLLDSVTDAERWTGSTLRRWRDLSRAERDDRHVTAADLPALRRLRRDVAQLVEGRAPGVSPAPTLVIIDADGRLRLQPTGRGARWLASAVWGEILLAQRDGSWPRLKTCRNPQCPCAFHDISRNNSRVWHDVRTCGNVANLRASRARLRSTR